MQPLCPALFTYVLPRHLPLHLLQRVTGSGFILCGDSEYFWDSVARIGHVSSVNICHTHIPTEISAHHTNTNLLCDLTIVTQQCWYTVPKTIQKNNCALTMLVHCPKDNPKKQLCPNNACTLSQRQSKKQLCPTMLVHCPKDNPKKQLCPTMLVHCPKGNPKKQLCPQQCLYTDPKTIQKKTIVPQQYLYTVPRTIQQSEIYNMK